MRGLFVRCKPVAGNGFTPCGGLQPWVGTPSAFRETPRADVSTWGRCGGGVGKYVRGSCGAAVGFCGEVVWLFCIFGVSNKNM